MDSRILIGIGIAGAAGIFLWPRSSAPGALAGRGLVPIRGYGGQKILLAEDAASALAQMVAAARRDGIPSPLLEVVSGYRSDSLQERLFARAVQKYGSEEMARKWVARPGSSEHATGRAVDLYLGSGTASSGSNTKLEQTAAYRWLAVHAAEYGFYPYKAEAWHWMFGREHDYTGKITRADIAKGKASGMLAGEAPSLLKGMERPVWNRAMHYHDDSDFRTRCPGDPPLTHCAIPAPSPDDKRVLVVNPFFDPTAFPNPDRAKAAWAKRFQSESPHPCKILITREWMMHPMDAELTPTWIRSPS